MTGPKKGTPLSVYVSKLHDIVSTVVTEESEESSSRLSKKVEDKKKEDVVPAKQKSRGPRMKQTERKHHKDQPEAEEIDDDIVSVSGSEDENQFTTLMGMHGMVYHPPSKKRQLSKYAHKQLVDITKKLDSLCEVMKDQQKKICRLQKENKTARNKIRRLKNAKTKQVKSPPLAPAAHVNKSGSDSDIQEVKEASKPDSTQPIIQGNSDSGSEDLTSAQLTQRTKKRKMRARIDSTSSADQQQDKPDLDAEDETDIVNDLRQKKADLEERYAEMERKLMEQKMDNRFREFQDEIREGINKFQSALMVAFGKNLAVESMVEDARESLCRLCVAMDFMGYIIHVGMDFVERVERSLLCGQVPEWQMKCLKMNTSHDDPVLGYVVEVVYKISMPVIVKAEPKDNDDDDLVLLGVSPGIPINPACTIDVKVNKEASWLHAELFFVLVSIGFPGCHMVSMWKPCGVQLDTTWFTCGCYIASILKPCGVPVEAIWCQCGNHLMSMWKKISVHLEIMWLPSGNHMVSVEIMWCPHGNHVVSIYVKTMWCPHGNHVVFIMDTTWFPHGHHVIFMWTQHSYHMDTYLEIMWLPSGNHMVSVEIMWCPHGNHVVFTWKPCGVHIYENHVVSTWKPCGFHNETTLYPCGNHVVSTWTPCDFHVDTT